jgi:hypothetical protein
MTRSVQQLISEIRSYEPSGNENDDVDRLYAISESFESIADLSRAVPAVLDAFERYPDAWWGNPGPLVHLLEHCGGHVDALIQSVNRIPTPTTVWMVNRVLNGAVDPELRSRLLACLEVAANDVRVSETTRSEAESFVEFQSRRGMDPKA